MSTIEERQARQRVRALRAGLILLVGVTLLVGVLVFRPGIEARLAGGRTVTAEFDSQYKLRKYDSAVKVGGLESGQVMSIEPTKRGTVLVTMRVEDEAYEVLGSEPIARIEPRNVLGGRYSVDLIPGGNEDAEFSGDIPLERTALPVELDSVLDALPTDAREGLQGLVDKAGRTLDESADPLDKTLVELPQAMPAGGRVLDALQGNRPGKDLRDIVTYLQQTGATLSSKPGRMQTIVDDLHTVAVTLQRRTPEIERVLATLPETVTITEQGLEDLGTTLAKLEVAARDLRPSAPNLERLVAELEPTLAIAEPVVRDLRPTLVDARPTVRQLVPVAKSATGVLGDLDGPVLKRLNGPISSFVLNPWDGGKTPGYGGLPMALQRDHKFYEEVGYMVTNLNRASMVQDRRGSMLGFQAGVGLDSALEGLPFSLEGIVRLALNEAGVKDPAIVRQTLRRAGVR